MATHPGFVGRRVLLIGLSAGAGLAVAAVLVVLGFRLWWCSIIAATLIALIDRVSSRGRILYPWSWIHGLDGQARVSAELKQLVPLGYQVFEPVEIRFGDVDHVVVGRTGVFAIETKNWSGRIKHGTAGLRRDGWDASSGARQAVRNAIAIRDLTGVRWVEAVLVCVDASVEGDPIRLGNLAVTTPVGLNGVVTSAQPRLSEAQIRAIVERLEVDG